MLIEKILKNKPHKKAIPFYEFGVPAEEARKKICAEMDLLLKDETGEKRKEFIKKFEDYSSSYLRIKYSLGLNSGTSALYFSLKAIGIKPQDEVITVANTFISTVTAIIQAGATCVFVDIDASTGMMDVSKLEERITKQTKAIIPVHMYGNMVNMEALMKLAKKYKLFIIEDACQAIGTTQKEKYAGTWGDIGCLSFHINKLVGAYADGGMVITSSPTHYEAIKRMAEPRWEDVLEEEQQRMPSRLPALSVPLLLYRFNELEKMISIRKQQYERYQQGIKGLEQVRLLNPEPGVKSSFRNVILVSDKIQKIKEAFRKSDMPFSLLYPQSLQFIDYLEKKGISLPETKYFLQHHMALPVGAYVSDGIQQQALELIQRVVHT